MCLVAPITPNCHRHQVSVQISILDVQYKNCFTFHFLFSSQHLDVSCKKNPRINVHSSPTPFPLVGLCLFPFKLPVQNSIVEALEPCVPRVSISHGWGKDWSNCNRFSGLVEIVLYEMQFSFPSISSQKKGWPRKKLLPWDPQNWLLNVGYPQHLLEHTSGLFDYATLRSRGTQEIVL